jgi:hypothetical protein
VIHLVKLNQNGKITAKCGVITDTAGSSVWWSKVTCPTCTPYIWVDDLRGFGKMMVHRDEVKSPPPRTKVMRRRSKPSA